MIREIHLHGHLATFGGPYRLDVRDPLEATRALASQLPGFANAVREGLYRVVKGSDLDGPAIGEAELSVGLGRSRELHLVPLPAGAKRGGAAKAVLGVALIATGFMGAAYPVVSGAGSSMGFAFGAEATAAFGGITWGQIAMAGVSMTLSGISSMLAAPPKVEGYTGFEQADSRPSFLFDGPLNTTSQGQPVPVAYGIVRAGSVVISAGLTAEQI